ncbi:MAG TPA: cytochrome C oxidase subunit IV family protein [Nitrospirota bacterium]|nr:cytochrome C oxidase subunit IV family protein [Nitrospirota bacterium]
MDESTSHTVGTKTFVATWIALLCFTGLTIVAARMQLGQWSMIANIAIASAKASLVLWFFMHLKYERRLFKFLLFVPILTISVIIGLTFFDLWYR